MLDNRSSAPIRKSLAGGSDDRSAVNRFFVPLQHVGCFWHLQWIKPWGIFFPSPFGSLKICCSLLIVHSWSSTLRWDLTHLLLWDTDWRNQNSKNVVIHVSTTPLVHPIFWDPRSFQISLAINWAATSAMMLWHQGMWVEPYASGDYLSLLLRLEFLFPLNGVS